MLPSGPAHSAWLAQNVAPVFVWSLVLVGLILVALVVLLLIRRKLSTPETGLHASFTLADLRKMRDSGQLTEEQYQKMRESVIGSARRSDQ
ncbi:MAG: SHOCT domain-containing protein [Phycisphaerae bacterium]|nr:SHOCT domain-containing protein [Phycisphaerae bacterium]MDW8261189.1 SHOCT domain-containing protein [Phycisphaerales bacterium]